MATTYQLSLNTMLCQQFSLHVHFSTWLQLYLTSSGSTPKSLQSFSTPSGPIVSGSSWPANGWNKTSHIHFTSNSVTQLYKLDKLKHPHSIKYYKCLPLNEGLVSQLYNNYIEIINKVSSHTTITWGGKYVDSCEDENVLAMLPSVKGGIYKYVYRLLLDLSFYMYYCIFQILTK